MIEVAGRYGGPINLEAVLNESWLVRADVDERGGRFAIVALSVVPVDRAAIPPFGFTSTALRQMRLEDFRETARRLEDRAQRYWQSSLLTQEAARRLDEGAVDPRRLSDAYLAQLALDYNDAFAMDPRRPVKLLAKRHRMHPITMGSQIKLARQRGWLPSAPRGVATAGFTPKLLAWKREQETRKAKTSRRPRKKGARR